MAALAPLSFVPRPRPTRAQARACSAAPAIQVPRRLAAVAASTRRSGAATVPPTRRPLDFTLPAKLRRTVAVAARASAPGPGAGGPAGWQELHTAAASVADAAEAERVIGGLLDAGAEPCAPARHGPGGLQGMLGLHPLHFACTNPHPAAAVRAIQLLLEAGARPSDPAGEFAVHPLHVLPENRSPQAAAAALQALIGAGADVEGRRRGGLTPLWWAAGFCRTGAMAEALLPPLLEAAADPNAVSDDGWSVMHSAAANPNPEAAAVAIRLLAAAGADVERRGVDVDGTGGGPPPLHVAAFQAPANIPALLACGLDPDSVDPLGNDRTALMTVCEFSSSAAEAEAAVSALLAAGADHSRQHDNGWRPLHYAATNTSGEAACACIRLLTAAGADPSARSSGKEPNAAHGGTPLHVACLRKRDDGHQGEATQAIIRALVAAGADVNALNDEGWCPLEDAFVNPGPNGPAAAAALWEAGGRYYIQDPTTGEWIGPDSLEDVTGSRAVQRTMTAVQGTPIGQAMEEMFEAFMEDVASGAVPEEALRGDPDLAFLLAQSRGLFGKGGKGGKGREGRKGSDSEGSKGSREQP